VRPALGPRKVRDVTPEAILAWQRELLKSGAVKTGKPLEDSLDLLRRSDLRTVCAYKGEAAYWDAHRDPEVQPTAAIIRYRFGSWAAACREAGIPTSKAEKADTGKRWTDEQCLEAVRRFFAGGHGWTSAHYGRWYKDNDAPSQLTIAARLGPWPALRKRILG